MTPVESLLESVVEKYVDTGLKYGWKSSRNQPLDAGHWNNLILSNHRSISYDHGDMPFIKEHPEISEIWDYIQSMIGHRTLVRAYCNSYTFGTDAYFHKDDPWIQERYGKESISETILIYLNQYWNRDWGGETSFVDDEDNILAASFPKKNKAVIFDSNIWHRANNLTRACPVLRSVLVFKTAGDVYNEDHVEWIKQRTEHIKHSNTTLFYHLYNTAIHVNKNFSGIKGHVVKAALYHSVYGTMYFNPMIDVTRDEVADQIGVDAEELVFTFCTLDDNRYEQIVNNTKNWDEEKHFYMCVLELCNLEEMLERKPETEKHRNMKIELKKVINSIDWRNKFVT